MVIPKWLSCYLNQQELDHLEQKVAAIEQETEAEIVPVIVRSSSNYFQTQVTLILTGLIFFTLFWHFLGWNIYWDAFYRSLGFAAAGVFVLFFVLPRLARIPVVQRLFTIRTEELEQCWKRARLEFYENRLHKTADQNGVLIFISLLEHCVIVLADEKISKTLPKETWQKVVDEIVQGLKQKKMGAGMERGLQACSDLLIKSFPVKSGDKNELANKVVIKE